MDKMTMLIPDGSRYTGNTFAELQARSQDKYLVQDIGTAYMWSLLCGRPMNYITDADGEIMVFNTEMEDV